MVKGILLLKGMLTIVSYLKKMCTPDFMAVMKLMKLKMPSVKLNHKPSLDRFLANPSTLSPEFSASIYTAPISPTETRVTHSTLVVRQAGGLCLVPVEALVPRVSVVTQFLLQDH